MSTIETREKLKVGLDSNGMILTPEEFDAIEDYDDLYRYELIHGVLVVNPIPSEAEVDPNEELGHWLRVYRDEHPQGSSLDVTLTERYVRTGDSRRRADRVIWAGLGRKPKSKVDPPTIAVEFVSKGKRNRVRDYDEKKYEYQQAGIIEYWVIDRFRRTMTVFKYTANGIDEFVVEEQSIYQTTLLPGF